MCPEFCFEWKSNKVLDRIPESQSQVRNFSFTFRSRIYSHDGVWYLTYLFSLSWSLEPSLHEFRGRNSRQEWRTTNSCDVFTRTLALSQEKGSNLKGKKSIICVLWRTYSAIVFTLLESYLVCSVVIFTSKIFCHFYSISHISDIKKKLCFIAHNSTLDWNRINLRTLLFQNLSCRPK
jgi:hypothetical protein